MASPETTRRLWSLGLFALPLVAVKVAAIMLGGTSPQNASASQPTEADALMSAAAAAKPSVAKVEWTAAQRAAGEHVRELAATTFGPTPMYQARTTAPVTPEPEPEPVIITTPDEPQPQFTLHAVMIAPNANKALINGRLYETGQAVDGGDWAVEQINMQDRSVTLRHAGTGETITITVQRPR